MNSMSNVENLPPSLLRRIHKEVGELSQHAPEGIKVFYNEFDVTDLQAVVQGPDGTPYAHGQFRVKLVLNSEFPSKPPKGYFLTKIFHPNVASNGEICVNVLKRDWREDMGLRDVLLTIKCLLIHPNAESALNEEAGRLILENFDAFAQRAKLMTEIHGRCSQATANQQPTSSTDSASTSTQPSNDTKSLDKLKKDKKRALKRL